MDFWTWGRQNLCGRKSLRASLWAAKESDGLWHGGIIRKWIFIFIRWPPVERTCAGVSRLRYAPASVRYSSWRRAENRNEAQSHTGLQLEQRFEALKSGTSMFLRSFIARRTPEPSQGSVTAAGGVESIRPYGKIHCERMVSITAWNMLSAATFTFNVATVHSLNLHRSPLACQLLLCILGFTSVMCRHR